jgi:hypothetical protein
MGAYIPDVHGRVASSTWERNLQLWLCGVSAIFAKIVGWFDSNLTCEGLTLL